MWAINFLQWTRQVLTEELTLKCVWSWRVNMHLLTCKKESAWLAYVPHALHIPRKAVLNICPWLASGRWLLEYYAWLRVFFVYLRPWVTLYSDWPLGMIEVQVGGVSSVKDAPSTWQTPSPNKNPRQEGSGELPWLAGLLHTETLLLRELSISLCDSTESRYLEACSCFLLDFTPCTFCLCSF